MPMHILLLFAETPLDSLAGSAGWVGTGLLGSVLVWLLFVHLPQKDKQVEKLIEGRDALVERLGAVNLKFLDEQRVSWQAALQEKRSDFRESLKTILEHCQREQSSLTTTMTHGLDEVSKAIIDLREIMEQSRKTS